MVVEEISQLKRRDTVLINECLGYHKTCGHKDERMNQLIKEFSGLIRLAKRQNEKAGASPASHSMPPTDGSFVHP